jgi:hypothetical protein
MPTPYAGNDVFPASTNLPTDLDALDAASVNVALEAVLDRTVYLRSRVPLVGSFSASSPPTFSSFNTASFVSPLSGGTFDIAGCEVGDLILCDAFFQVELNTNTDEASFRLIASDDVTGTPTAETQVPEARVRLIPRAGDSSSVWPASMGGIWEVTAAGTTRITIQGKSSGAIVFLVNPLSMRGLRTRPA